MSKRHMFADKTELVLFFPLKKKMGNLNVTYNDIIRIQFEPCKEFSWFRQVDSEKIQIVTRKRQEPIEYTKLKEKSFFEEYKKDLEEFAKRNKVSFINNLSK